MDNLDFNYFCKDCKRSDDYRRENCFTRYRIRRYEKGEYITFKGDRVKELAIAVDGAVNVSFVLDSGVIMRSIDHCAPTPIGAIAILSKEGRYMVDTKALEPLTTISITREDLISQMSRCRDFMTSFVDFSASRVGALSEHLALLSQRSIAAKLAYYILICSKDGKRYDLNRSIKSLAEHLCVERPSLSRVIAQLSSRGIITYHDGSGEIIDIEELKSIAE